MLPLKGTASTNPPKGLASSKINDFHSTESLPLKRTSTTKRNDLHEREWLSPKPMVSTKRNGFPEMVGIQWFLRTVSFHFLYLNRDWESIIMKSFFAIHKTFLKDKNKFFYAVHLNFLIFFFFNFSLFGKNNM